MQPKQLLSIGVLFLFCAASLTVSADNHIASAAGYTEMSDREYRQIQKRISLGKDIYRFSRHKNAESTPNSNVSQPPTQPTRSHSTKQSRLMLMHFGF